MEKEPPKPMITVEKAAKGYKVLPRDVLEWIEAGKIQAVKQKDNTYLIPLEDIKDSVGLYRRNFVIDLVNIYGKLWNQWSLWLELKSVTL